jgi:hypothetical protein
MLNIAGITVFVFELSCPAATQRSSLRADKDKCHRYRPKASTRLVLFAAYKSGGTDCGTRAPGLMVGCGAGLWCWCWCSRCSAGARAALPAPAPALALRRPPRAALLLCCSAALLLCCSAALLLCCSVLCALCPHCPHCPHCLLPRPQRGVSWLHRLSKPAPQSASCPPHQPHPRPSCGNPDVQAVAYTRASVYTRLRTRTGVYAR